MTPDSNPPLYFHCTVCGECCSSWNIPAEGEKARALLERPWVQQRLRDTRRELVKVTEDLYRIPLSDENVCVFLGKDKKCLVEANEGLALKPNECQRFPFATTTMPDGTARHDTSAACKLVAEKLLLAFQPVLPAPDSREAAPNQEEIEAFPAKIRIGLFHRMDWSVYERFLAQARDILNRPDATSEAALHQLARLRRGLPDALEQTGQNMPAQPDTQRFPAFWARMIALFFLRKPYGSWSWLGLLRGKSYDDPRIFGFPLDLRACHAVRWDPACDHRLNAYLYNLLCRKLPVARGHSLAGMLAMASVAAILVRWYARALASVQDKTMVSEEDVSLGIRLVERYYCGHQPRFLAFFGSPWRALLLETFLLR